MASRSQLESDRRAILQLHKDWWESNAGIDIPRMATCFPTGKSYLMFNSNGHPYFGIDEKVHLWSHYKDQIDVSDVVVKIIALHISGDMGWLACEGESRVRLVGAEGTGTETLQVGDDGLLMTFRATEVYERNDGDGGASWKMWHFHGSPTAPLNEPRPGFSDSAHDRGLGGNPWGDALEVVGT